MNSVNTPIDQEIKEILRGLAGSPRSISPKYFYDQRGSILFEQICELPEYYLTRTELGIMRKNIDDIADAVGPAASVIEFGAGAGLKTRFLLENLVNPVAYLPVDISPSHLEETATSMQEDFPTIEILPVVADFTRPFPLPQPAAIPARNLVYFPGSTIGNFEPEDALKLLRVMCEEAGSGGALLIGIDLKKDSYIIENAYNDSKGITAQFNLNALRHLNRKYGGNFELEAFEHRALYNESAGRIEMHLVSRHAQEISIGAERFSLEKDEQILTEYCHKYSLEEFRDLTTQAGFRHRKSWMDAREWFAVQLYEC
jgi:dimethylhistidine N-methyltransferase